MAQLQVIRMEHNVELLPLIILFQHHGSYGLIANSPSVGWPTMSFLYDSSNPVVKILSYIALLQLACIAEFFPLYLRCHSSICS